MVIALMNFSVERLYTCMVFFWIFGNERLQQDYLKLDVVIDHSIFVQWCTADWIVVTLSFAVYEIVNVRVKQYFLKVSFHKTLWTTFHRAMKYQSIDRSGPTLLLGLQVTNQERIVS